MSSGRLHILPHKKSGPSSSFREIIGNRDYTLLWAGQTISQVGDALTVVAIPLLVYALGHSVASLTLAFVIESLPWIVIGPIAGVFVDRVNRRNVLILSDLLRAVLVVSIFFLHSVPLIYLMSFLSQALATIFAPARSATIPELIGKERYVQAISLSQSSFQTVQIIGPFIAAGIIALSGGPRAALLVDAISFFIGTGMTLLIRFPAHSLRGISADKKPPFFQSLREGAAFLVKHRILRYATSINILKSMTQSVVLVGSVLYVKSEMGLSANNSNSFYGIVVTAIGVGIVIGTTLIGTYLHAWNRRLLIVGGLMLQGTTFLLLLFHPGMVFTAVLFGLSGFASSGALAPNSAFYAESTPNEVRGRVYSVVNSVIQVAQILGYSIAGFLASEYSSIALFLLGGVFLIVAAPLLTLSFRGVGVVQHPSPLSAQPSE